jgi:hypothetical protein
LAPCGGQAGDFVIIGGAGCRRAIVKNENGAIARAVCC